MRALCVRRPGARTTVEDLGRADAARHGIPPGGAFDGIALRAANRLVGNRDDAAGLELTLLGPELENAGDETILAALAGAPWGLELLRAGEALPLEVARPFAIGPGERLRLGAARGGLRGWLAVAGGVDVPLVLGSRATCAAGRFGGIGGRALVAGDLLPIGAVEGSPASVGWRDPFARTDDVPCLALLPGPQVDRFAADLLERLCAAPWEVDAASDRVGIRLRPRDGASPLEGGHGIPPEGTTLGAIQVPPDGAPIVLGPDRPVTGGYAKPALVARAHLGLLASLRPGDVLRFAQATLERAVALARERLDALPPR
ncbi:MAG: biotin-dependent carboxyltransferase family protein [Deltaproteobacteria bacterium]|nr:biotin-dependent carboxyltransferase family protein [Deltaproteobacteria bacterium]